MITGPATDFILQHLRAGDSVVVERGKAFLRASNGTVGAYLHPLSLAPFLEAGLLKKVEPGGDKVVYTLKKEGE